MTPEEKREMVRQQVASKIHWGAEDTEVYQWLAAKHGIIGSTADEMLATAHRAKRKAVRKRAMIHLVFSGVGIAGCSFALWLMSFGRVSGSWRGMRFGYAIYGVAIGLITCTGIFLKNLYYLLTGDDVRSVE